MIEILLIVVASIVGFVALFYLVLGLASRNMRRAATAFLIAVMEERYRHAESMLDRSLLDGLDHRQFIGWLKQLGLHDLAQFRRYPGDYAIGTNAGSWSPVLGREDGAVFKITIHLRKTEDRWFVTAIESGARVLSERTITADQGMDRAGAQRTYKRQRRHVKAVFDKHVADAGCPCDWKQFVYWTGKPHGRGRHDVLQNDLVQVALGSGIFQAAAAAEDTPEVAASFRCTQCDTLWQHFSEEWRMGAIAHRLHRVGNSAEDVSAWQGFESDRIFQTAGAEAVPGAFTLSLDEWVLFMGAPRPPEQQGSAGPGSAHPR